MDDKALFRHQSSGQVDDFVVRQFSPVRIERMLLTRLFDLTTGKHVLEEVGESPSVPFTRSQTVPARRKGAA